MKKIIESIVLLLVKLHILTPIRVARLKFFYKCHKWPNFEHPVDVNEKINWMKFYGDTSMWPVYADKYAVRQFVADCGLSDCLIPLIGKWDSVEEINWESLPNQFVMKCNNGSGDVVVCKDKSILDIEATKRHFRKMLIEKLSVLSGEPHYAFIKPCIIAEELLDASTQPCGSKSLVDYKIWTFNGKPLYVRAYWDRNQFDALSAVFDTQWNHVLNATVDTSHIVEPKDLIPKPICLDKMLEIASVLGKGNPVARIDLYEVNGKVYFGEITMTSSGGYMNTFTNDFLEVLGNRTILPIDK